MKKSVLILLRLRAKRKEKNTNISSHFVELGQ